MEVLLTQDVPKIGKKNDLLLVGDGFALNYLLPKRYAVVATPLVRRHFAEAIRKRAEERERERELRAGLAASLSGRQVTFTRKATKAGKLYGAISEDLIIEALKTQLGVEMPASVIEISDPIKALGTFQVRVKVGTQRMPLSVVVKAETPPPSPRASKIDGDYAKNEIKKPKKKSKAIEE